MRRVKVIRLLPVQSGVSTQTGNPWKNREVILEADDNVMHPDRYVARLFGDAVEKFKANEGDTINVVLHHRVDEYNGRFFQKTSIVNFEINS